MKLSKINALVALAISGFLVVTSFAQAPQATGKQANLSTEKGKEGSSAAVSLLNQAGALIQYARENESPIAMLAAVQILRTVPVQDNSNRFSAKKTGPEPKGEEAKEVSNGKPPVTLDPEKLLEEAKPWAQGDDNVRALINAEIKKGKPAGTATLGSTRGVISHADTVRALDYDDYTITFYGGEVARVAVVPDGNTDVDLVVFDENGNEIARDDNRGSSGCVVSFTPRWTGPFRVRVRNEGRVYSRYALITN
jgi:hypothetical protein